MMNMACDEYNENYVDESTPGQYIEMGTHNDKLESMSFSTVAIRLQTFSLLTWLPLFCCSIRNPWFSKVDPEDNLKIEMVIR